MPQVEAHPLTEKLLAAVKHHWGFSTLRPLQAEAMNAVLHGRDSLVVLPTGGGKSLCYQAPAVVREDVTVVISPLIALMKDQVDALTSNGVAAVALNSGQSPAERRLAEERLHSGQVRLLYVSPERLVLEGFQAYVRRLGAKTFVIDEAHCISHWGHDFRQEYRQLHQIKNWFPEASVHGFTATATERVRRDIIEQLRLKKPEVLVGDFDRPNLTYRVLPRTDLYGQTIEVLKRHPKEAGIVYCLRRVDVDAMTEFLIAAGYKAQPYHAGLSPDIRKQTQDAFAAEKCDLVVATIAFGMGIDRSNIRLVLHTAMPKSVEHYQQETGRAGRDGLEAECVLLYSAGDTISWRKIMEKSANEKQVDRDFLPNALKHLDDMDRFSRGLLCRHRALVEYFGQKYPRPACHACDVCLGDAEPVPDALVVAQKILSCVARVKERFGVAQVVSILRGENTEKLRRYQHDQLSTFGLLREHSAPQIRDWVYQLISQETLVQEGDEYPILKLNAASWAVMQGQQSVRLTRRSLKETRRSGSVRQDAHIGLAAPA